MNQKLPPLIAFATYADRPELTPDDALVLPALVRLGYETGAVPWNDPSMDWSRCAAVSR